MIFEGAHGASKATPPAASLNPVGFGAPNISPEYSAMVSPSSCPNPTLPAADRNRTQRVIGAALRARRVPSGGRDQVLRFAADPGVDIVHELIGQELHRAVRSPGDVRGQDEIRPAHFQ